MIDFMLGTLNDIKNTAQKPVRRVSYKIYQDDSISSGVNSNFSQFFSSSEELWKQNDKKQRHTYIHLGIYIYHHCIVKYAV